MDLVDVTTLFIALANLLLFALFLSQFRRIYRQFAPLIAKFTSPGGGVKLPSWKEAVGFGLYKFFETADMSKWMPGFGGEKKE